MNVSYVVQNPHYSLQVPIHVFNDYHELIIYIRKNKIDSFIIWKIETNSWNDDAKDISKIVYIDAWNGFDDYRDRNY